MKPSLLLYRRQPLAVVLLSLTISWLGLAPARAAFQIDLQGQNTGDTNWNSGPVLGWQELDLIPLRTLFTGGPATNQVITVEFDHTQGTIPGMEDLTGFTNSSNVIITAGPTLSAPAGVDIWSYTFTITITNSQAGSVGFFGRLAAGSHAYPGASLHLSTPGAGGQLQIGKPGVEAGTPDLFVVKSGPSQAKTNETITYVISYASKATSPDTAVGVQVTDILPSYVTYVANSANKGGKLVGNTLTWDLNNLTPGKSGSLTYKVVVTNNVPVTTTFANFAQIHGAQNDSNPADNTSSVTTTVIVTPSPVAYDDFYATGKNLPLTIPAPGVLLNDSNALSALLFSGPDNGTLTFNANGSFLYTPATNFLGTDIFAYQARNTTNTSGPAVVTIDVTNTCFLVGTTDVTTNNTPGQCGAIVSFPPPTTTGDCAPVICTPPSGSFFPVGTNTVTCTNTDGINGSFLVTVLDTQPPTINCSSNLVLSTDPGQCSRSNVTYTVTASDNCTSNTAVVCNPPSGSTFLTGTTTVTCTATDANGNTNSCSFTVTILDDQPPTITCPATNLVLEADAAQCSRSNVIFSVTATDNCGAVSVVSLPPSGSTFPIGTTVVTNIATDASGNQTTCTFTVNVFSLTIIDTEPPVITCPTNLVLAADLGQCSRSNVTFLVTATDNCSVTNLVSTPASGSTFPVGVTTVTNIATDAGGNTSTCTFTVTVRDNQGPGITCPANVVVNAAFGQCASNVTFNVTANDLCGSVTNLVSVPASGSAFPVGVTTVTNTATDNSGNTSRCTFTVTIRDNQPPTITCPSNLTVSAAPGEPTTNVTFNVPANDLCGSVTNITSVPASGSAFPVGVTTVTNTATDNSGNSSQCTFTVTVTAVNRAPVADAQSVTTAENTPKTITLTGSDPDGDPLTFGIATSPANGMLSGFDTNTGTITYTPNPGFLGNDSFTFRVNDGLTNSTPATVTIGVGAQAELAVFKTGSVTGGAGTNLSFTITVTNLGPSTASNVVVFDQLPASYALVSAVPATATVTNGLVQWPAFNLAALASSNFSLTVTPGSGGVFTNVAYATNSTPDPNPTNNDGTSTNSRVTTFVQPLADVAVFKTGPASVLAGGSVTYTITVTNLGPVSATNVVVTDLLPTNLVFVSASSSGVFASNIVTWPTIAALANGSTTNFIITVTAPAPGTFTNIAVAVSTTPDPDPSNNNGTSTNSQVTTTAVQLQFGLLQAPNVFNPQTGLFEQRVTVTNTGVATVAAFQLLVGNINGTNGVPRTNVFLYNATGTNVDSWPYVQYNSALDPGSNATLILEFYVPDRKPFTNSLEVVAVLPDVTGTNAGGGVVIDRAFTDFRFTPVRFVIEWTSVPGTVYTIIYSDSSPSGPWSVATPSVSASANRVQWYDDGPPKTISVPLSVTNRFYRVITNP